VGVRAHAAAPVARARSAGPGLGATAVVVGAALVLLLANGRPVGTPETEGAASWLLRGALALAGLGFHVEGAGEALVGKALAAALAALAAGALFAAVVRRHGLGEARWAAMLLALGTTLAAAAQAWSGESAAALAVALAVLALVRAEDEDTPGFAALAGLPLGLALSFQPSAVALVLVLLGAVLFRWRARGLLVLAWAVPGTIVALLTLAVTARPQAIPSPGGDLLVLLASPAKGALVFAPVALVGIVGLVRALRVPTKRLWDQPQRGRFLPIACGVAAAAHLAWLGVTGRWDSPGDFWGPRWVAPAWPLLLLFLPEGFAVLKFAASLLAVVSVAVQALGALAYDGRWDRMYRDSAGLAAVAWDFQRSPILFQARERVARVARPGVEGGRLVVRERVLAPAGASGSFLSFARTPPAPTGVERTMSTVRFEGGARVASGRLELRAAGDALCFVVPAGSRLRRLEVRVTGRGQGTLGVAESGSGKDARWHERPVSGTFGVRFPYYFPQSGGPDLRVALRAGGPIAIESVAVVPPSEPENVLRLP
jgi:hypothetical protein